MFAAVSIHPNANTLDRSSDPTEAPNETPDLTALPGCLCTKSYELGALFAKLPVIRSGKGLIWRVHLRFRRHSFLAKPTLRLGNPN